MDNSCVVVTGGGTGLGRAIAWDQARRGRDVVVVGRRSGPLEQTAADGPHGRISTIVADVGTVAGAEHLRDRLADRSVVGVVTAAGGQGDFMRLDSSDLQQVQTAWRDALTTNLDTAVLAVEALVPQLVDQLGRVVLISSTSAMDGRGGPYATAKAAVNGYARDLAGRLGPRGITANVIAPGLVVDTGFFEAGGIQVEEDMLESSRRSTLLHKLGTPADIAAAAAYLLSAEGGWITGQVLSPNGGTVLVQ